MSVTFEQVEKLKNQANVTWEEAKAALEAAGGDLLEAVLLLERQGKIPPPRGGFYSTCTGAASAGQTPPVKRRERAKGAENRRKSPIWEMLEAIFGILRHCTVNQLEVWRGGRLMASIPVVIVILLLVVAFWASIPLFILGLVIGCRYRFSGPDLNANRVNEVMDSASDTMQDMVGHVRSEFRHKQ